ncbi:hypothetical protein D4R99_01950 [bacterium]|nr:MAG: hypothetical protein D4R99_01950 [bacterium]
MFFRFIFFAFIGYILLYIIKLLLKVFMGPPKNPNVKTGDDKTTKQPPENLVDKRKAVDADFEDLK